MISTVFLLLTVSFLASHGQSISPTLCRMHPETPGCPQQHQQQTQQTTSTPLPKPNNGISPTLCRMHPETPGCTHTTGVPAEVGTDVLLSPSPSPPPSVHSNCFHIKQSILELRNTIEMESQKIDLFRKVKYYVYVGIRSVILCLSHPNIQIACYVMLLVIVPWYTLLYTKLQREKGPKAREEEYNVYIQRYKRTREQLRGTIETIVWVLHFVPFAVYAAALVVFGTIVYQNWVHLLVWFTVVNWFVGVPFMVAGGAVMWGAYVC
eukprot:PhF_6_TR6955/c1_g1_i3/m.10239